jgi:hypothetical protein
MTPFPLLLLLWGVAMWVGVLPNRIGIFRFNPTPLWTYARRTLGQEHKILSRLIGLFLSAFGKRHRPLQIVSPSVRQLPPPHCDCGWDVGSWADARRLLDRPAILPGVGLHRLTTIEIVVTIRARRRSNA